ncbi:Riboflavin synthase alpha chain [Tulasnella sp. 403]|nr:Riboflavin synthase alpha chain [Tulasnella sp. 403]
MFTGLVEHQGRIVAIDPLDTTESGGGGWSITVGDSAEILNDCHIGDSISVNGACLTVTEFNLQEHGGWFKIGVAPETLDRTDLGELTVGQLVNLERALAAHVRFGGHFVQGHIDTTANVFSKTEDGNSLRMLFQLPPTERSLSILPYLIPKGFIAIDGASLTLTSVNDEDRTFGVMLIAHTQNKIGLGKKEIGRKVNIEVDMVGKYVEKAVWAALGGRKGEESNEEERGLKALVEKIVEDVVDRKLAERLGQK